MSTRGKKILDIDWEKDGVKIKVPVKTFERRNRATDKPEMYFRATFGEAGLDVESTDINVIRQQVTEKLDTWYTVDWKLYMMVEVGGGRSKNDNSSISVSFETEFYAIGTDSRGRVLRIVIPKPTDFTDQKNFRRWWGRTPMEGMPDTGGKIKDNFGHLNPTTRSLVPATPENVAAADNFKVALEALLDKMHHHFAPERVEAILARGAGLFLLGNSEATR